MRGVLVCFGLWLMAGAALAQDITLTARDGSLSVAGTLRAYDGETYRLDSAYGLLTIDAATVLCDGPACPDLTAPKAVIRLIGDAEAAAALLPEVIPAFARAKGLTVTALEGGYDLATPAGDVAAEIRFAAMAPDAARAAVAEVRADLIIARFGTGRVLALDALVPIVAPDNPTPRISTADLAKALAGQVTNWQQMGGPDRPLVLHGLASDSDLGTAIAARLGQAAAVTVVHPDLTALAAAVAADPWALALTGRALAGAARVLPLTDSCGFELQATSLAVKAEDYPLTLPVYLIPPPRQLPPLARDLLEFLAMPAAQEAITRAGYIARSPERAPLAQDGGRLINAIAAAGTQITLTELQRLSKAMAGADRLSMTFRFQDGSDDLDAVSTENLNDLARRLQAGLFDRDQMTLVGFSDGTGDAARNQELALDRATAVLARLHSLAPDVTLPGVQAFGEALPMACDETAAGRRLNRRVEIWLRPKL